MKTTDAKGFIEGITQYIQKKGRQSMVPKVQELFGKLTSESQKERVAKITTSVPLTDSEQDAIKRWLTKLTGFDIAIDATVDKAMIGGIKIRIGDWVVDTSLSGQLDRLSKDILL